MHTDQPTLVSDNNTLLRRPSPNTERWHNIHQNHKKAKHLLALLGWGFILLLLTTSRGNGCLSLLLLSLLLDEKVSYHPRNHIWDRSHSLG